MKNILLLGPGNVGQRFLKQTENLINKGVSINLQAISDSRTTLFYNEGFNTKEIDIICEQKQNKKYLSELTQFDQMSTIKSLINENSIIVDSSATAKTIPLLLKAIEVGAGIVLANKIPLTYDNDISSKIMHYSNTRYEATVGAGLPVIASLKRVLAVGDDVNEIFSLVSGTLGYVCSEMDKGKLYADIIHKAHALGYTEPDPRDDLGGMDAARKAIILARTCGWNLSMEDVTIQPLFNADHASLSVPDFMKSLDQENDNYSVLASTAKLKNEVLRYLIHVTPTKAVASLQSVPKESSFGGLYGTENRVEFHSKIFNSPPLAICGAGAGADNTAAGILADVLDLL